MDKKFLPGDIVRYGFGTAGLRRFSEYNTVCIVSEADNKGRYHCIYIAGDYWFDSTMEIKLDYEDKTNELLHTFNPQLHSRRIKNASS